MLRKLLKCEFKSTARTFGVVYLIMVVLCGLTGILDTVSQVITVDSSISVTLLALTMLFLFAAVIITTVLNLNRFEKGVFKDEGYLLNTLPVRPWQIITSKLLPAVVWTIVTILMMELSLVLMVVCSREADLADLFALIQDFLELISTVSPGGLLSYLIGFAQTCLMLLLLLITFILQVYASISLGHLFGSHRTAWAVGIWFVLNWAQSTLFDLVMPTAHGITGSLSYVYTFGEVVVSTDLANSTLLQMLFYLVWAVIFWAVTQWVLSKKLNLE
ncbi:MAG: hypothetical protein IJX71_07100 [Oscillospiraceae bacterium]|nr:hypothetical protein [Oscillospiraceae bacterium]